MQPRELLDKVAEAGHVAELARLLVPFNRRRKARLGEVELLELANQTAGANYRYPNPEPALKVALAIGLVHKSGQIISLTETGRLFVKLQGAAKAELSVQQASLLLGLFLDEPRMATHIRTVMRQFGQGSGGQLEARTSPMLWDRSVRTTATVLQQLGVLEERADRLRLSVTFESLLPRYLVEMAALTEEALWERLEAQRRRAKEAEELVLVEEQRRLIRLGRGDLAALVVRISAENVSAGYDVSSFEKDGAPRAIEVKSSVGRRIRFEWSAREREVACEKGRDYWIYFVPLSGALENRAAPILMLRDPITLIQSSKLVETASSYVVWANTNVVWPPAPKGGPPGMIEWPT